MNDFQISGRSILPRKRRQTRAQCGKNSLCGHKNEVKRYLGQLVLKHCYHYDTNFINKERFWEAFPKSVALQPRYEDQKSVAIHSLE
jgi:hypothetical protein